MQMQLPIFPGNTKLINSSVGFFKKEDLVPNTEDCPGSIPGERNVIDFEASKIIGTGATRVEERIAASRGEFGKLLGLDRIPEARCLRTRLKQIIRQNKSEQWGMAQANKWVRVEGTTIYYIDGHAKVYFGDKANLGKKHISRLKLCMPTIMEFWVNNHQGMPYFVVTGEVNEKPGEMLSGQIIPRLKQHVALPITEQALMEDPELPRFTLTFDREGYSSIAFKNYWENDRIAVLTYNKNVKDKWDEVNSINTKYKQCPGNFATVYAKANKTVKPD